MIFKTGQYDKIDENIDLILSASGTSLRNYSVQKNIQDMRDAMRKIMSDSYHEGMEIMGKITNGEAR